MSRDVHVYANPTIDIVKGEARAGGPGLYAALAASILGFSIRVYGAIGSDGFWVLEEYVRRGAKSGNIQVYLDEATTRMRLEYKGGRRIVFVESLGPRIESISVRTPRVIAPVIGEFSESVMRELSRGSSLDVQGLVRVREKSVVRLQGSSLCELTIRNALVVHGDLDELRACVNADTTPALISKLLVLSHDTRVILSLGYRGALYFEEGEIYYVPAWGPRARDPTGMGDILLSSATYLATYTGLSMLDAVRVSTVVCGLHAQQRYDYMEQTLLEKLAPPSTRVEAQEAVRIATV